MHIADDIVVRTERGTDACGIDRILIDTFGATAMSRFVGVVRPSGAQVFLGDLCDEIVGVAVTMPAGVPGMVALGPVAVEERYRRKGIGSVIVRAALSAAERSGVEIVVVSGAPLYFRRFGFVRSVDIGIAPGFEVDADAFLALPLGPSRREHVVVPNWDTQFAL